MKTPIRLLAFAGSGRKGSLNRKLMGVAVASARAQGAEVTELQLKSDTLPLYDGDLEANSGLPAAVVELKRVFAAHDGWIVVSPEYNSFFTPLMKNTIDWLSRPAGDIANVPNPFPGKTAVLFATSPGALGGLRALPYLRLLLSKLGVLVAPAELAVGNGTTAIGDGQLSDAAQQKALDKVMADFITLTRRQKAD